MQKKIIALAVAGLVSGAAFAQSNVTIYGVVDHYYAHSSASNGGSQNVLNAGGLSGSRVGFKGVEALGNGLSAVFTLEYALASDVGAASWSGTARQSFVGLTGGFGTAVAGRLQTPGYNFAVKYDAHGASIFSPVGQLSDNSGMSVSGRDALARQDNAIAYVSPNMSGFTVVGAYAFGTGGEEVKTAGANPTSIYALSVDYDMGPLSVGFVHHNVNDFTGADIDQTENGIGVNYNFGMGKLFASYQNKDTDVGGANVSDANMWNIGARFNAGANSTVGIAYGRLRDDRGSALSTETASSWGLDYQYSMSKRTTAYAGYSRVSNSSSGMGYGLLNNGTAPSAGGKESQFAVGLRHTF